MATLYHSMLICSLLFFISPSTAKKPKALVLPVSKDSSTLQYLTQIYQRAPLVPIKYTLDLGGQFMWTNCQNDYVSSSYKPAICGSKQCSLAESGTCGDCSPSSPGCNNNTCGLLPDNTLTHTSTLGELAQDRLKIQSTNGYNPGKVVKLSKFLLSCGTTSLLQGLASGVKGMAGLGRTSISLPSQFSSSFGFKNSFAICLSSSTKSRGVTFFGQGPYIILPKIDVSKNLMYTPLIINPVSTASAYFGDSPSSDYFINVTSIAINGKVLKRVNASLLKIDSEGYGGTKISTIDPYTTLQTSIYKAIMETFLHEIGVLKVASVAPFKTCFNSSSIGTTLTCPAVLPIDLVLHNKTVFWRIFGSNSVIQVSKNVMCLAFVDAGDSPRTSIVIGGYQLEDNLLQFDVASSTLGFTSSLLFQQTNCANFNFTSSG